MHIEIFSFYTFLGKWLKFILFFLNIFRETKIYLPYNVSCSDVELKFENCSSAAISVLKLLQIPAILLIHKFDFCKEATQATN